MIIDGIGIDTVNIQRIERLSETVKNRLFHTLELQEAMQLTLSEQPAFLAGRFAVKEALGKALGCGLSGISPRDIWVENEENGKPVVHVSGKAEQLVAGRRLLVSISHDSPMAVAVVLIEGGSNGSF